MLRTIQADKTKKEQEEIQIYEKVMRIKEYISLQIFWVKYR